jgi:hypothetical protein
MAPGLRSPPAESTASRTPRSLTLTLTIGSHGRGPRRDAPNAVGQSQAEHAAAREKQRQVGGRSPCLVRGRQRGPNNPRHSETAVQAGKNVLGRAALLHATRPHKDPPATLGRSSCVQTFPVPDPIPRGVILYGGGPPDRVGPHKVGLSLSPSNHAAVSLRRIDGRSVDGRVRSAAWAPATQSRSHGEPGACRAVAWPVTGAGWRQLAKSRRRPPPQRFIPAAARSTGLPGRPGPSQRPATGPQGSRTVPGRGAGACGNRSARLPGGGIHRCVRRLAHHRRHA